MSTLIQGERVVLRQAEPADAEPFHETLFANRDIWPGFDDIERVRAEMLGPDKYAVVVDGAVAGLIQWWEEDDPEYRHAGIDIALHPDWQDKGLGRDAVRTMARWLLEDRQHHRVTIDPLVSNERAVRCYEAVGFKVVGVMRRYQLLPDGSWGDGLLMDLLPEDLS